MAKITIRRILIASVVLIVGGIVLVIAGATSAPSPCWGHLGCDYYVHSYSSLGYAGMILIALGAISFFEALLFTKAHILSRLVLAIGVVLILLLIYLLFGSPITNTSSIIIPTVQYPLQQ